jgi:2-C-methyl-D-erythritol 2,4-cyclodiphosphate synthase
MAGIDRVGIGTDLHRLEAGRPLILGGVCIDFERGLVGHSDGDVVLHAAIDAILGASGQPDIGELFPDTDPRWAGANSADLTREVVSRVSQAGWEVVNMDVVIQAEWPKMAPYKTAMRERIADLLGVDLDAVNVKAKTGEGLDAVGQGRAIACLAAAGLRRRT